MTEEHEGPFGGIDWGQMEQLANEGPDEVGPPTMSQQVFTEEMVNKRLLWDVSPHEDMEKISAYLQLPTSSPEGMEKEHDEAHERTERLFLLTQPIELLTKAVSRAVVANMVVMSDGEDIIPCDGPDFTEQVERMEIVIYNSALAILGELVDWNLIHTPHLIPVSLGELEEVIKEQQEGEHDGE